MSHFYCLRGRESFASADLADISGFISRLRMAPKRYNALGSSLAFMIVIAVLYAELSRLFFEPQHLALIKSYEEAFNLI